VARHDPSLEDNLHVHSSNQIESLRRLSIPNKAWLLDYDYSTVTRLIQEDLNLELQVSNPYKALAPN
jgi:hypothetical protein